MAKFNHTSNGENIFRTNRDAHAGKAIYIIGPIFGLICTCLWFMQPSTAQNKIVEMGQIRQQLQGVLAQGSPQIQSPQAMYQLPSFQGFPLCIDDEGCLAMLQNDKKVQLKSGQVYTILGNPPLANSVACIFGNEICKKTIAIREEKAKQANK